MNTSFENEYFIDFKRYFIQLSNKQEIDIRFLSILGTKSTLSNIMNLSPKNNFKFPTDLAETTSPVPTLVLSCLPQVFSRN